MFGKAITPACKYCEEGIGSKRDGIITCKKFGEVRAEDYCQNFDYAPLKRVPVKSFPGLANHLANHFANHFESSPEN